MQCGQSMVEYLILTAIVATIFFAPFGGEPPLLLQFAQAVGKGFARFLSAIALPV
ncbi:hypothetical protein [Thiobacter aerophilum]|uniref:Uncharacterized protein n=1 Tax=Thiobacter aerophilum TaxID=3121275 RepID=A0ABV0EGN7_9BURK